MSTMLEQAIVDAKSLREAAIKNAEAAIVRKIFNRSKGSRRAASRTRRRRLPRCGAETEVDTSFIEEVPMAHTSRNEEDEMVVVDLR